jgi:hypothetical protein
MTEAVEANDALRFQYVRIALGQARLQRHGTLDRVDDGAELGQHAVTHDLEDAPVVTCDFGLEELFPPGFRRAKVPASSRSTCAE